jgi:hypothetical protein
MRACMASIESIEIFRNPELYRNNSDHASCSPLNKVILGHHPALDEKVHRLLRDLVKHSLKSKAAGQVTMRSIPASAGDGSVGLHRTAICTGR